MTAQLDQIRFIDANGAEQIRVNNNAGQPAIVARTELQNKSSRPYFRDAIGLQAGQHYISPVDLNIEHGRIEEPFKPTLRFAAPVDDAHGVRRGVLVLNLLYGPFLEAIDERNNLRADDGILMVLNRDGYWLKSDTPEDEWGFMLGKPARTFQQDFPGEWPAIAAQDRGTIESKNGLFVFDTVRMRGDERQNLKAVSWVSMSQLRAEGLLYQHAPAAAAILLLLIATTVLTVRNRVGREIAAAEMADKTQRLENIVEGTRTGTWEWNVATGEVTVNRHWAEMLGYNLAELGRFSMDAWLPMVHPEDMAVSRDLLEKHFAGILPNYESDLRVQHKDGRWIWVHSRGRVLSWMPDGAPKMMFGTYKDISQRKLVEAQMQHVAHHDNLTGLPNRALLNDRLHQILLAAKREKTCFALVYIDLDEFKPVNDNYGHAIGDELLHQAARRILDCVRASDTVARVGGDEFVAVLARIQHQADAQAVTEKMRSVLSDPFILNGLEVRISSSIGIAIYPDHGENAEALSANADAAMYRAKKGGRNQVQMTEISS
jgi:diguanylate cyclase (GGDEF)-like protein/PAS domain S-box-containing protein